MYSVYFEEGTTKWLLAADSLANLCRSGDTVASVFESPKRVFFQKSVVLSVGLHFTESMFRQLVVIQRLFVSRGIVMFVSYILTGLHNEE